MTKFVVVLKISNSQLDDLIIRPYRWCANLQLRGCSGWLGIWVLHTLFVVNHQQHTSSNQHLRSTRRASSTFAHCAMILGDDGAKLSKRHGAVSVMQYRDRRLPTKCTEQLPSSFRLVSRWPKRSSLKEEMIEFFSLKSNQQVTIHSTLKATLVEQPLHQDFWTWVRLQNTCNGT